MIRWPWRRQSPTALEIVGAEEWHCVRCDRAHEGMMDLAAFAPDPWSGARVYEPNGALHTDGDFLSEDFCVLDGRNFLVRCVLDIPVHGLADKFSFGCWGSLSRANFDMYVSGFDDGSYQGEGPWSSWLCNTLFTYTGDRPERCTMYPQLGRQRPTLAVADPDHPLARDQREGITPEKLLAIYRHYGHEAAS